MRMFRAIIPFLLIVFCASCAQVGVLSGGGRDVRAPRLLQSAPELGATSVNPTKMVLRFDEFVELVNPAETFRIEPSDATLSVVLNKKEVIVSLNEVLEANTTYSLCIDGGVKDITEGNDSIYRVAFSTGKILDSLKQSYRVGDAYTKKSIGGVSIGLFSRDTSKKARYLTKSNKEGWARLDYLPKDSFFLKAFIDVNKNGSIENFEPQEQFFGANVAHNDSVAFLLSVPRNVRQSYALKTKPPGLLVGHIPQEIDPLDLRLNGKQPRVLRLGRDSLAISLEDVEIGPITLCTPFDTIPLIYSEKDASAPLKGEVTQMVYGNPVRIDWNAFLSSADVSKLKIVKQDSSLVLLDSVQIHKNALLLYSRSWPQGKLKMLLESNVCQTKTGKQNTKQTLDCTYFQSGDLGSLIVRFASPLSDHLVLLEREGKTVQSYRYAKGAKTTQDTYRNLIPGDYQVVIIDDLNGNGFWDPFRPDSKQSAEPVRRYTQVPKIRANWEVEVNLE